MFYFVRSFATLVVDEFWMRYGVHLLCSFIGKAGMSIQISLPMLPVTATPDLQVRIYLIIPGPFHLLLRCEMGHTSTCVITHSVEELGSKATLLMSYHI